jgi:hypothetical protein
VTVTDEDVYDYLEHFGVKGQRWGVRKAKAGPTGRKPAEKSPGQVALARKKRNDRIVTGLAVGAIGLLIANRILVAQRGKQLTALRKENAVIRRGQSAKLFGSAKSTPMTLVRKGFAVDSSGAATPINKILRGR